jgi:hypothetical protein
MMVRFRIEAGVVFLLHKIQIGFGAHPASHPTGTGVYFIGIKAARA